MDSANQWIVEMLGSLSPSVFYTNAYTVAVGLISVIGGIVYIMSFLFRVLKELSTPQGPDWSKAIYEMLFAGLMTGIYFAVWGMMTGFFNGVYLLFSDSGTVQSVFASYGDVYSQFEAVVERSENGLVDWLASGTGQLTGLFSWVFFTISNIVLMTIYAMTKLFHGLLFALAIIWGVLVWVIRPAVNLTKGWLLLSALVLFWPLVELVTFLFLHLTIVSTLQGIIPDEATALGLSGFETAMGVLNFIMAGVLVAVPMLTSRLLANSDVGLAIGASMAGTAMSIQKAVTDAGGMGIAQERMGQMGRGAVDKTEGAISKGLVSPVKAGVSGGLKGAMGMAAQKVAERGFSGFGTGGPMAPASKSNQRSPLTSSDRTKDNGTRTGGFGNQGKVANNTGHSRGTGGTSESRLRPVGRNSPGHKQASNVAAQQAAQAQRRSMMSQLGGKAQ
uniref:hypothetical protein n=1 Tax=Ferrimonas kyonanensis TaxID=364763 RepID=UPI000555D2A6